MTRRLSHIALQAVLVAAVFCVLAVPARAQSIGARAGVSGDPDQFYFGGHFETPPLADQLRFRPNVEIGVGDDHTLVSFNLEFAWHFAAQRPWHLYAGGGPALNLVRFAGNTESGGGLNLLVGVQHRGGLFGELKFGTADSPRVKFGVGYAVQW